MRPATAPAMAQRRRLWRTGSGTLEFVLVSLTFWAVVFAIVTVALAGVQILWVGGTTALDARGAAGLGGSSGTSLFGPVALSAASAPGCARYTQVRASGTFALDLPGLAQDLVFPVGGGATVRNWDFYGGPPDDGCQ